MKLPNTHRASLSLFPLPDVVHFPRTLIRLQIFEDSYRPLMEELAGREGGEAHIGTVLLKPDWQRRRREGEPAEIFATGTASRVLAAEVHDDCCVLVLEGEFRFKVESPQIEEPYGEAMVRPVPEPRVIENDPGILLVRRNLLEVVSNLAAELRDQFPFSEEDLEDDESFEQFVNHIAAEINLPPLTKLKLLRSPLPERALSLLSEMRDRKQVLDALRPYRPLAEHPESN